jgi:hypothetical protein
MAAGREWVGSVRAIHAALPRFPHVLKGYACFSLLSYFTPPGLASGSVAKSYGIKRLCGSSELSECVEEAHK